MKGLETFQFDDKETETWRQTDRVKGRRGTEVKAVMERQRKRQWELK